MLGGSTEHVPDLGARDRAWGGLVAHTTSPRWETAPPISCQPTPYAPEIQFFRITSCFRSPERGFKSNTRLAPGQTFAPLYIEGHEARRFLNTRRPPATTVRRPRSSPGKGVRPMARIGDRDHP